MTNESELKPVATDDLIKRLEGRTRQLNHAGGAFGYYSRGDAALDREAAAALLQLQQERDAAQADGDRMLNAEREARVEIARQAMALALELKALEAEVERLRAALTEARQFINEDSPDWRYAKLEMLERIDRALNGDKS